uniref:Uncharacterized protein n=1 Tax=Populus trichocarpa TaxID=3694 RepID=U7E1X0_POPTR
MVEFVMLVTVAAAAVKVQMAAVLKVEMHCCSSTLCYQTYPKRLRICLLFLPDDQGLQMVEFVMLVTVAAAAVKVQMAAVLKVEMHCCSSTLCYQTYPKRLRICLLFLPDDQGLQMVEFVMLVTVAAAAVKVQMAAVLKVEMHCCSSTLCYQTYPKRLRICLVFLPDDQGLQMVEFVMLVTVAAAAVKVQMAAVLKDQHQDEFIYISFLHKIDIRL